MIRNIAIRILLEIGERTIFPKPHYHGILIGHAGRTEHT